MTRLSHYLTAASAAVAVTAWFKVPVGYALLFTLSAQIPDWDLKIDRRMHRGVFHSLGLWLLLFVASVKSGAMLLISVTGGGLFHVLMDSMSMTGVPVLFTRSWRLKFRLYATGTFRELLVTCFVCFCFLLVAYFKTGHC